MGELLQAPGRERIAAIMRTYAPTWCMELPTAFASSGSLEKLQQETIGATKERMMREIGDALGMLAQRHQWSCCWKTCIGPIHQVSICCVIYRTASAHNVC